MRKSASESVALLSEPRSCRNGDNGSSHHHTGITVQTFSPGFEAPIVQQFDADECAIKTANVHERTWQGKVSAAITASLVVNVLLLAIKVYAAVFSKSMAVTASAVDSCLDLLVQIIIYYAERGTKQKDPVNYPAGKSRLEPIGIVLCASIMGMAAFELIMRSVSDIYTGIRDEPQPIFFDGTTLALLGGTVASKMLLWFYCLAVQKYSASVMALAADHRNDILSNAVAIVTAWIAHWRISLWWADPLGALLISVYILWNWSTIAKEQIEMLVGKVADPEFIEEIRRIADTHHRSLSLDILRAYHFGTRYLVEVEVVMPGDMTVREAHDISLALQQEIETLEQVERAFVHVDHMRREGDEHDAEYVSRHGRIRISSADRPHGPVTYQSMDNSDQA